MKICRFNDHRVGLVRGDRVIDISRHAQADIAKLGPCWPADPLVSCLPRLAQLPESEIARCESHALNDVKLLSPVQMPAKIVAAPVNYAAHIAEMQANNASPGFNITDIGKAGLFMKAPSSLIGASQAIEQRFLDRRTDYECELVVVMGHQASQVSASEALSHVAGYCVGLDITVRGTEDRSFRKSIDTYTVLGPWLTTADEVPDPNRLQLTLWQNGEVRQDTSTADLVYKVERLIEFASSFYTLYPGDVLFTGTPQGVGPIRPGDALRARCEGLGEMTVQVRAHAQA
jgi:2-keto-4-pentenoate hydratase/2-oxohepta-3-ene-1,7-dioic acid hydratase in catechol pathway